MLSTSTLLATTVAGNILYCLTLVIYRLCFHPLARYPGPKLAAISWWYEFYYDGILYGKYTFKIQELHKKYGPIIRVTPDELHCNDPEFLDTLYPNGSIPRDKYLHFINTLKYVLNTPNSLYVPYKIAIDERI